MHCARWLSRLFVSLLLLQLVLVTHGCQRQVCRRKRSVYASKTKLTLVGCTIRAPTWVRQVAYCLSLNAPEMALTIKRWYKNQYSVCEKEGCQSSTSSDQKSEKSISKCVTCWKNLIPTLMHEESVKKFNVTEDQVLTCIDKFIYAFLNDDLPVLTSESSDRFKGNIKLANVRPAEYWWSVTVKLPCKPPVFEYVNAYCANSFADNAVGNEFVLVQNRLVMKQDLTFYVDFSDTCRFTEDDIDIIWGESLPAASLPQISTFPSQYPPKRKENVNIYYDYNAFLRLVDTDGKIPSEAEIAVGRNKSLRRKRQADDIKKPRPNTFSILFPCAVNSFQIDQNQKDMVDVLGEGQAFLVSGNRSLDFSNKLFNFTLDYGFDKTGCVFQSKDAKVAPGDLLFKQSTNKPTIVDNRFACIVCDNMSNEIDCNHMGRVEYCHEDEICQSEIRQITITKRRIKKSCKQKRACDVESIGQNNFQCNPGMAGSVCRCCCSTSLCNMRNNACSL